ncbi:NADH dehydrogenase Fe-S protein subunit 4 ndufs4 [Coelomomyces lativittatus]|nr:NADH dehydrogenase Fe-S protein subunit 4 ndufs4 [Coelomomyces lativittatus]
MTFPSSNDFFLIMSLGMHNSNHWCIAFDTQDRWQNPLIGWTSSADPMQGTTLKFDTKESAIRFAENQGWQYKVMDIEPSLVSHFEKKTYAENFTYSSKKLRLHKTK